MTSQSERRKQLAAEMICRYSDSREVNRRRLRDSNWPPIDDSDFDGIHEQSHKYFSSILEEGGWMILRDQERWLVQQIEAITKEQSKLREEFPHDRTKSIAQHISEYDPSILELQKRIGLHRAAFEIRLKVLRKLLRRSMATPPRTRSANVEVPLREDLYRFDGETVTWISEEPITLASFIVRRAAAHPHPGGARRESRRKPLSMQRARLLDRRSRCRRRPDYLGCRLGSPPCDRDRQ